MTNPMRTRRYQRLWKFSLPPVNKSVFGLAACVEIQENAKDGCSSQYKNYGIISSDAVNLQRTSTELWIQIEKYNVKVKFKFRFHRKVKFVIHQMGV